ncbi:cytosine permease [Pleurocapsa sp. FMAR1]|uniref:cytosine permease n=1 Tax=Pleurocapsa sp. FMAR1 TaxID=3040204 RepID=UPI0029C881CD|nr:cytosine permease [Pleurocapsa sp. FMAR1]
MSKTTEPIVTERSPQPNEDFPLTPVPVNSRKPIWSLAPLLIGFTLYSGTLFGGGLVGPNFRFFPDLIGLIVLGNLILGLYAGGLGYIAAKTGLSTVLMSRCSFGEFGSRWVDFILGFTQVGWYAWGSALIADLLIKLAGVPPSLNWLLVIIATYLFCITAYMGYQAMDWISRLAVPAMIILMIWSLSIAWGDIGGYTQLQALQPAGKMGVGEALTVIISTFISGGTQVTNWSRFASSPNTGFWATFLAFFLANGFLIFSGAFCALVYGNEDIVQVMAQQGLLFWGLVLFLLNMWTTQDNTIYAFSVAGAHMFRTSKRTLFVLGGATFALVLSLGGIYEALVPYLVLLGTFIPPIGGVVMADFWLYRKQGYDLEQRQPNFNWAGIIAYILASAIAYFTPGIKPINGIVAAALIYWLLSSILKNNSELQT